MDVMGTVRLHEIGKTALATNPGNSGDLLVPNLALLDQLEVKREDREIAAPRAPSRVIGRDFFLR